MIYRRPSVYLGTLMTFLFGRFIVMKYIKKENINIVMPRSIMPSMIVHSIIGRINKFKIIYDADGLAIQEKVEFQGLSEKSLTYKILNHIQNKILIQANSIIVRSKKSIEIMNENDQYDHSKFFVSYNGRSSNDFRFNQQARYDIRETLGIAPHELVFVYCGSLTGKYLFEQMCSIFEDYHAYDRASIFLVLSNQLIDQDKTSMNQAKQRMIFKSIPYSMVPLYLSASDVALSIIDDTFSMQAVCPTKLAEYLLAGLPTICSVGIGDTADILRYINGCHLYDNHDVESNQKAIKWITTLDIADRDSIRNEAIHYFSVENAAASYMNAINYACIEKSQYP